MDEYQVFISYRRKTGEKLALLLHDRLRAKGYRVFFDFEAMRSGKFNEQLYNVIDQCTDFLLILSEGALDRCCHTKDWVRLEIEHALNKKKNIVPVIDRDYKPPESLPESLGDIHDYQGVTANTEYFDAVVERIEKYLKSTPDASVGAPGTAAPIALAAANIKYCAVCGAQLLRQAEICPQCGVRQGQAPSSLGLFGGAPGVAAPVAQPAVNVKYCTTCGKPLPPTAESCPNCAVQQADSPDTLVGSGDSSSRSMGFFVSWVTCFFESWVTCFTKWNVWKGKASQSEYAYFTLSLWGMSLLFLFIRGLIIELIGFEEFLWVLWIEFMIAMITLPPWISVTIRRFHDFNAPGWLGLFVGVLPIPIILIIFSAIHEVTSRIIWLIWCAIIAMIKGTKRVNRLCLIWCAIIAMIKIKDSKGVNKSGGNGSRRMGLFDSWVTCFTKFNVCKGRASQSEYAYFTLTLWQMSLLFLLGHLLLYGHYKFRFLSGLLLWIEFMIVILTLIPLISVTIRRFHDFNTSGWLGFLVGVLPVMLIIYECGQLGVIVDGQLGLDTHSIKTKMIAIVLWLIWCGIIAMIKGTKGVNKYGT